MSTTTATDPEVTLDDAAQARVDEAVAADLADLHPTWAAEPLRVENAAEGVTDPIVRAGSIYVHTVYPLLLNEDAEVWEIECDTKAPYVLVNHDLGPDREFTEDGEPAPRSETHELILMVGDRTERASALKGNPTRIAFPHRDSHRRWTSIVHVTDYSITVAFHRLLPGSPATSAPNASEIETEARRHHDLNGHGECDTCTVINDLIAFAAGEPR